MTADILWSLAPQGSVEWLAARVGRITGSMAHLAREHSDGLTEQQRTYVQAIRAGKPEAEALRLSEYRSKPRAAAVHEAIAGGELPRVYSAAAMTYAMDLAREREGGEAPDVYVNAAMRKGTEEEPKARQHMEIAHDLLIETVGFAYTPDGKFGVSVDGLIGDDETWECKTMVSSATLFRALVYRDVSEYLDQVLMGLWMLRRKRARLTLWAPDLPQREVTLVIERDEAQIDALVADLLAFDRLVEKLRADLRRALGLPPLTADEIAPWDGLDETPAPRAAAAPAPAVTDLPDLFPA